MNEIDWTKPIEVHFAGDKDWLPAKAVYEEDGFYVIFARPASHIGRCFVADAHEDCDFIRNVSEPTKYPLPEGFKVGDEIIASSGRATVISWEEYGHETCCDPNGVPYRYEHNGYEWWNYAKNLTHYTPPKRVPYTMETWLEDGLRLASVKPAGATDPIYNAPEIWHQGLLLANGVITTWERLAEFCEYSLDGVTWKPCTREVQS